mgnify:CR=1 FL=1
MARKTFVDLSDTLNAFRVKTNVISYNVGDLDSLHSSLPDSDLVQAINHLRLADSNLQVGVDSNQTQIIGNDSDIAALNLYTGFSGGGGTSLQQQILNNDSDILALQSSVDVRNVQLSILKSDGSLVKRIFGFSDSGD